ncbi:MAG: hypothetical protein ABW157_13265 [Candidatus Thiodiazotropha sp. LLP2]
MNATKSDLDNLAFHPDANSGIKDSLLRSVNTKPINPVAPDQGVTR